MVSHHVDFASLAYAASYLHIFCSKKVWRPETVNLLLCKYMCSIITTLSELELCRTQTRIKEKPIIPLWIIGQLQFITSYVYPGLQPLNSHSNLSSPPLTLFHSFFPFHSLSQAVQHPLLNTPCLLDWLVESAVQLISFSLLVCVSNSNHRGTRVIKVLYFPITFYLCFILNVLNSGQFQLVSKVVLLVSV